MVATFVGVGLLFATLVETNRTAVAAAEAAKGSIDAANIAKKAYEAEHRPWLTLAPLACEKVAFVDGRINITIALEAKNISNHPAIITNVDCRPYRARGAIISGPVLRRLITEGADLVGQGMGWRTGILIPGETAKFTFTADAETDSEAERQAAAQIASGVPEQNLHLTLSAPCVVFYRSVVSDSLHYTAHTLWIKPREGHGFTPNVGAFAAPDLKAHIISSDSDVT